MSKKAKPALIGGFVIGAITLLAVSVMLFGGGQMFKSKSTFVSYFNNSAKGLRVGSTVMFRGVNIGYVTDISLFASSDNLQTLISVTYQIDPKKFRFKKGSGEVGMYTKEDGGIAIDDWIRNGLRAQLDSESFVTGQLSVELDFKPNTEAVFYNEAVPYPEIPSVTSGITQAIEDAEMFFSELKRDVDIKALSQKLTSILSGVDQLANSQELRSAISGIDTIVNSQGMQALPQDLTDTTRDLNKAINSAQTLIQNLDDSLVPAAKGLADTLDQAEQFLAAAKSQVDGQSVLSVQLSEALTEVSGAARSIRVLADYLEQHPESLLFGKKK